MTNPTDAGGENPTIRDVSPPSDTNNVVEIPELQAPELLVFSPICRSCLDG